MILAGQAVSMLLHSARNILTQKISCANYRKVHTTFMDEAKIIDGPQDRHCESIFGIYLRILSPLLLLK